ncbi:Bcr/CflA family drug resistance efflux transporter [Gluconobacter kanchanaburiensis NBRC 103587]|uniref:Bcr/CflA family efflux transporter n=2 Tax=Gluconobacter kanchanaburiensis TaxID=563199 RepID=A0A511B7M6_9PROT|nr:multidrug ABC transporter [Gluconobacter kanchanaburiensis NBRC 103587]GEK95662.1 Bcr/CflA family drug resistance efflux transporter [Gluconobacter kanchanaburiensis NBRC 103587]
MNALTRVLIGLIFILGPVSTDMYLPAFPALEHDLGHGAGSAQLTLTAWLAGLAIGQFTLGPLCDRYGRKLPLLCGLVVYAAASVGLALTNSFHAFCILRFVAALGGAISSVAPRAMVRDVATGSAGVKLMSQLMLIFGLGPLLAPSIGSFLLDLGDWRLIFWANVIFGLAMFLGTLCFLPETLPMERRFALPVSGMVARYRDLSREPLFCSAVMVVSFATFTMFAYLSNAPALFEGILHFSPHMFAIFFGLNGMGFILGSQINARLANRFLFTRVMETGMLSVLVFCVLGVLVCLTGFAGPGDPWILCVLIWCTTFSLGFIGPNAGILALTHHGHQAGAASALMGTMNWTIAGLAGVMMSFLPTHWVGSTSVGMLVGISGCWLCDLWRRRLDPESYLSVRH